MSIDYDITNEVTGNSIDTIDDANIRSRLINNDYDDEGVIYMSDAEHSVGAKRDPEFSGDQQKRNIVSALRAKMRRSKSTNDAEENVKFSPVLSVGECCTISE